MADPITATVATLAVVGAGSKIIGGVMADKSSKREANLLRDQGQLAQEEAYVNAQRQADEVRKFAKTQKLAYLKNGVTLEGSPLLVLDETFVEGQKEVDSIVKRGVAQNRLFRQEAEITRNRGRAAMTGGILGAFGDLASTAIGGYQAGLFGNNRTPEASKVVK